LLDDERQGVVFQSLIRMPYPGFPEMPRRCSRRRNIVAGAEWRSRLRRPVSMAEFEPAKPRLSTARVFPIAPLDILVRAAGLEAVKPAWGNRFAAGQFRHRSPLTHARSGESRRAEATIRGAKTQ